MNLDRNRVLAVFTVQVSDGFAAHRCRQRIDN
ncbi:Uncharacterised protein [Vibrio cholerae]|nr:Uncharacterised protein [Vibrio cholerae]CSI80173.1 Uncharacterised protein [Vibrio cholerae]